MRLAPHSSTLGLIGETVRLIETKVPAPFVAVAIAISMRLIFHVVPASDAIEQMRNIAVTVTSQLSGGIALAAFVAFWKAKTTINPFKPELASALVTHGIYHFTRNPMYLSLLLLLLAYAIHLWTIAALAGPIAFVGYTTWFQIKPEERALESKFGSQFVEYKGRVRRWL